MRPLKMLSGVGGLACKLEDVMLTTDTVIPSGWLPIGVFRKSCDSAQQPQAGTFCKNATMPSGFRGDPDRPEQEHPQYSCAFADARETVLRSVRCWTQTYLKGSFVSKAAHCPWPWKILPLVEIAIQSSRFIEVPIIV